MATFKPGDRARIRCEGSQEDGNEAVILSSHSFVGTRCVDGSVRKLPLTYRVSIVGAGPVSPDGLPFAFEPHELVPLTDPKADAFVESVKSWKPEPVAPPLPVKESA